MNFHRSPIARLLIVSAAVLVSSCGAQVRSTPTPPADLFARPARPQITPEALTSERAYEAWREDRNDWGIALDNAMWRACRWFADAGAAVTCGDTPPESQPR